MSAIPNRFDHDRHASGAIARARRLRSDMTLGEKRLWDALRRPDLHIRRQAPIGRYVADFIQHSARAVIEVDSPSHDRAEAVARDAERDRWLASQGHLVLRFRDEAMTYPETVAEHVAAVIAERQRRPQASAPFPSMGKGRDGVEALAPKQETESGAGANLRSSPRHRAYTPTPAPPPSRGRDSAGR